MHCSCIGPHPKACVWVRVAGRHSACATGSSETYGLGCSNTTLSATPCSRCLQSELRPKTSACSPSVLQPAQQMSCSHRSLLVCCAGDIQQACDTLHTCFCPEWPKRHVCGQRWPALGEVCSIPDMTLVITLDSRNVPIALG